MANELILSSGYLSTGLGINKGLVYKNKATNTFIDIFLNKSYLDRGNNFSYSEEADNLYKILLKNDKSIKDIDNYMRTISLAKRMFSDMSFLSWVSLQSKGLLFTASHIDFLRNTLEFISKGRGRVLDTGTWRRLVVPSQASELGVSIIESCIDELLDDYSHLDKNITDLLVTWINKPNGYVDLISTLYVIFGSREPFVDFSQ